MFSDEWKNIFWFDHVEKGFACGVPEGELDEFIWAMGGPFIITQRYYRAPGRVAAVVIECVGGLQTEAAVRSPFREWELRENIQKNYGLECICREHQGWDIGRNEGRFYSDCHDPSYPQLTEATGDDWRVDRKNQSMDARVGRLQEGRCPIDGLVMEAVGLSGRSDLPFTVQCARQGCGVLGHTASPGTPASLAPLFSFLLD